MSKYLDFVQDEDGDWNVESKKTGLELGFIQWRPNWKCHVVYVADGMIFDKICLRDVADFLQKLDDERKRSTMIYKCESCGKTYTPTLRGHAQKFCSNACKVREYKKRKEAEP